MRIYAFNGLETLVKNMYAFFNFFFETLLQYVFIPQFEIFAFILLGSLTRWWYLLLMALMGLLDLLQLATGAISGGRKVMHNGNEDYLINILLYNSGLSRAIWGMVLIAMILGVLFSVVSVVGAMKSDIKGHVGKVMLKTSKIMLMFLLIPMLTIASVNIGMLVLEKTGETIAVANGMPSQTKISSVVFSVATAGAQRKNIFSSSAPYNYKNEARYHYITDNTNDRYYWNLFRVALDFDFTKMNFIPAVLSAVFFIYMYLNLTLVFAYFIFQIIFLFITSPFFVAAMALDDGRMYKKWRDLFLTKLIAGLGLIASIRIYETIIIPLFLSDTIRFMPMLPAVSDILGPEYFPDIFLKMFFVALFGRAVCTSHTIVTSIINEQAAKDEQAVSDFVKKSSIKVAKFAVEVAITALVAVGAVVAGVFTAGAGTAAIGGAGVAAKGAATVGAKAAATGGKMAAKQVAKQAAKKAAKNVAKKVGKKVAKEGMKQVSNATNQISKGEEGKK